MEPAEILSQIRPCDMERPYVFISYSAIDHPRVWEDVLTFQQLGYNVWLDERNLDKTKDSWKEDALAAISDLDCKLVVFYVSSSSLTSENCYRELKQTTEQLTMRIHFGAVPFIAVDVVEVGDIGVFTQSVYEELMSRPIPKREKTDKAIVLSKFTDNFFDSNNERVRVHPKDEPHRKLDYYEEIIASFPVSAKIYEPVIELPSKKAAEEARRKAEEEAKRKAEEAAKKQAEAEALAAQEAQRKAEEEAKRKAEEEAKRKAEAEKEEAPATPTASLAEEVAKLLRRRTDLLGKELPEEEAAAEPAEEQKKTPSLEELIRQQMGK